MIEKKLIVFGLRKKNSIFSICIGLTFIGILMVLRQFLGDNNIFPSGALKIFMILFSVLQILPIFMPIRISKFLFFNILLILFISGIILFQDMFLEKENLYLAIFLSIYLLIENYIFILDKYADKIDCKVNKTIYLHLPILYRRNLIIKVTLIGCLLLFCLVNKNYMVTICVLLIMGFISILINYFLLPSVLLHKIKSGYRKEKKSPLSKILIYKLFFAQKNILFLHRRSKLFFLLLMILISYLISLLIYKANILPINLPSSRPYYLNIFYIAGGIWLILFLIAFSKKDMIKIGGSCLIFNICGVLIGITLGNTELNPGGFLGISLLISLLIANISYAYILCQKTCISKDISFRHRRFGLMINKKLFKPLFFTFCCFSVGMIPLLTEQNEMLKSFGLVVCFGSLSNIFVFCFYIPLLYLSSIHSRLI